MRTSMTEGELCPLCNAPRGHGVRRCVFNLRDRVVSLEAERLTPDEARTLLQCIDGTGSAVELAVWQRAAGKVRRLAATQEGSATDGFLDGDFYATRASQKGATDGD